MLGEIYSCAITCGREEEGLSNSDVHRSLTVTCLHFLAGTILTVPMPTDILSAAKRPIPKIVNMQDMKIFEVTLRTVNPSRVGAVF